MKAHFVDGTFELFRCFHGAPRHTNAEGKEVGAVRGYLHTMLSLLKGGATHVAVGVDALPLPRGPLGDDPGMLIRSQAPLAFAATRALGMRLWPMVRFQADDALATAAHVLKDVTAFDEIVICTTDTDLYQTIVDGRVVVLDRIRKHVTDATELRKKLGIEPHQFTDQLALVGAPAKGIPGVPGFGAKTAARLLAEFGSLENIPADAALWDASVRSRERLAATLNAHREEALLVKALATLRTDLPIDLHPATLEWRGVHRAALHAVIAATEAIDINERLERWDRY